MQVVLAKLDADQKVLAEPTRDYRASLLHKRYRPDDGCSYLRSAWRTELNLLRAEFLTLLHAVKSIAHAVVDVPDAVILEHLLEGVQREQIAVYRRWIKPPDAPVRASMDVDRWYATPSKVFQQTHESHRILPKDAVAKFDQWFPVVDRYDDAETGPRLVGLKMAFWKETPGYAFNCDAETMPTLAAWAVAAFAKGELCAYQKLQKFTLRPEDEGKPLTAEIYKQNAKIYAEQYDIDLGKTKTLTDSDKIPKKDAKDPQYYKTSTTEDPKPLKNEVDDTCPSHNCRSESTATADKDVKEWFGSDENLKDHGDETLGFDGGGGFLASTTRVVELPEPKTLYRYCGGGSGDTGPWWTETALEGDPRVECALFPAGPESKGGTGERLVKCHINKPTKVLMGIGAPRCSNKPGGPVQICLPYKSVGTSADNTATLLT